ncbi:hypothetical protein Psfp_00169 [Pelotomaculum sp. FP]|uniref:hypothetical protein n=1 Tax=Pelotomaculum sp. FP TaxID=261474 RepID=UPI001064CF2D|nr:hypothetical protein [Pelotomaculum sp. FP]TEB18045.1 hypothetical protein Psfp_00169 [Pelotomaculum sp. FP]
MIILTNEELQQLELDSFLPMGFMGVTSKATLSGYEMTLKVEPLLVEKIAEEYNKSCQETPVRIKILNTEFIIKGVETKPPYRLMLVTNGNADTLSDLIKAGLKVSTVK